MPPDFIVVDTEGREQLSEIAIVNSQGKLIYEAFTQENLNNHEIKLNLKPLKQICLEFLETARSKLIICHNAAHDIQVLKKSFKFVALKWEELEFKCTLTLAQQYFSDIPSYSLEYLSKKLNLKVRKRYFNPKQAHSARYDTEFTYQLYLKILETAMKVKENYQINPFLSHRVDNPFQDHVDLTSLYQPQFETLKSIITDIKHDKNHQSKGAIVIGEAGMGKTHLMMRLAKEVLKINRLLFIRRPNQPDTVVYHIYCRMLESFVQEIPETGYTQLEHLLAHSFVKLISTIVILNLNQKDRDILETVNPNPLNLYQGLGAEGAQKNRDYWQHIEKRAIEWWMNQYGMAGYSAQILKGLIKFCSYRDRKKKELVMRWLAAEELSEKECNEIGLDNWNEEKNREDFSLEAISVFSKLSLLDEPLIIIFDQLEAFGLRNNRTLFLKFGEAIKEIFTIVPNSIIILNLFPERWRDFQKNDDRALVDRISQYKVLLEKPSEQQFIEILRLKSQEVGVNLDTLFTKSELKEIIVTTQA